MTTSNPLHSLVVPGVRAAESEDFGESLAFIQRAFQKGVGFPSQISDYRDFSRPYPSPPEVFTTSIVAQCLLDVGVQHGILADYLELTHSVFTEDGLVHFFHDRNLLSADLDCTAVAHSLCLRVGDPGANMNRAVEIMLANTSDAGVLEVYLRPTLEHRGRIDHCVLANALYLLCQLGIGEAAEPSWDCLVEFLDSDAYLFGTRYYPSPDVFLYFTSRIVRDFPAARTALFELLRDRLIQRRGADTPCFDRALRVAASANVGLDDAEDLLVVASARRADGSWASSPFFRYGRTPRYFGCEVLSTVVGAQALIGAASAVSPGQLREKPPAARSAASK